MPLGLLALYVWSTFKMFLYKKLPVPPLTMNMSLCMFMQTLKWIKIQTHYHTKHAINILYNIEFSMPLHLLPVLKSIMYIHKMPSININLEHTNLPNGPKWNENGGRLIPKMSWITHYLD
jgi:hypothetical protein